MLHLSVNQEIRSRTVRNIQRRFMVDIGQADRVQQLAQAFTAQVKDAVEPDATQHRNAQQRGVTS